MFEQGDNNNGNNRIDIYDVPVITIGDWVFSECASLTSITIPNSVTEIGDCVFDGCSSLTFVTIPSSVITIGDCVFHNCSSLTSINIPSSVTTIGEYALNCSNLKKIFTTLDVHPGNYGSPSTVSIVHSWCTISFDAGDGAGAAPSVTADYGSTIRLPSSGFTREGYTFAAWATIIDGTIVHYPIGSTYTFRDDDGSTRTFTAYYTANHGTIIFDVNGGVATDASATAVITTSGDCVQLPNGSSFPRSDYTLISWTSSTRSNIVYPVNYYLPITDATSTIVMKAVWVPDSITLYEINFQPNSAQCTNATGTPFICKFPAGMTIATPATGFVLSGHTFTGWNTQPDGKGTAFGLGESVKITGKLTLYAQYSENHDAL